MKVRIYEYIVTQFQYFILHTDVTALQKETGRIYFLMNNEMETYIVMSSFGWLLQGDN